MLRLILSRAAFVLALYAGATVQAAPGEDMKTQAQDWGQLHGAGIYCKRQDVHEFGIAVTRYFKARTSSRADYDALVQIYGVTMINTAHLPPSGAAGNSCEAFGTRYRQAWDFLQAELGN